MTRRIVHVGSETFLFSSDGQPPLAQRHWALVRARVVDELTGEPPLTNMLIETDRTDISTRTATDGLVGLVGVPARAFPALDAQSYKVGLTVSAEGYVVRRETVTVNQNLSFPAVFAPTNVGDLALHREPVAIRGRTVLDSGGTIIPVAGATVRLKGIWRRMPPANVAVPAELPLLVSLEPPTYFARKAPAGRMHQREMTPVVGQDKQLLAEADAGSVALRLSDRVGLAVGSIIVVGEGDPERTEFLTVKTIAGASTADQPALVTLDYPTRRTHAAGTVARPATPQPAGADNNLNQDCIEGDTVVFLTGLAGLGAANVVEITGAGALAEYHLVRRFTVKSDANGYFRLPPLSRVAQVEIEADDGGAHTAVTALLAPRYGVAEHHIDFVFR